MNRQINYKKSAHYKKGLHRKRKKKAKDIFIPRIIADSNIWYMLGENDELFDNIKSNITPIYNNLWELCNTGLHDRTPERPSL
ncbi:hypothetical protein Barb4_01688 [Bacteroidales bacterium Barb4]|nr:hypothetical protein Barb4_01688 [Bacteroidales bacterium Barb4]